MAYDNGAAEHWGCCARLSDGKYESYRFFEFDLSTRPLQSTFDMSTPSLYDLSTPSLYDLSTPSLYDLSTPSLYDLSTPSLSTRALQLSPTHHPSSFDLLLPAQHTKSSQVQQLNSNKHQHPYFQPSFPPPNPILSSYTRTESSRITRTTLARTAPPSSRKVSRHRELSGPKRVHTFTKRGSCSFRRKQTGNTFYLHPTILV